MMLSIYNEGPYRSEVAQGKGITPVNKLNYFWEK